MPIYFYGWTERMCIYALTNSTDAQRGGRKLYHWVKERLRTLKEEQDWEVTEDGLYIATRDFLKRRGYCCAHRCRNCPYINWRNQPDWQPLAAEHVQSTCVSSRVVYGAQSMLHYHEQQLQYCKPEQREKHQNMIEHYQNLLERWGYK